MPHAGHELVAEERPGDLGADAGVLADELPLLGGQRSGLEQHAVRDADLADVVEEGDVLQLGQALVVPSELATQQRRVAGHAAGVAERVVVLGAERRAQCAQVGEVQPLDFVVQLRALDGEGDQLGDRFGDGDLVRREPSLHVVEQFDGADHLVVGDEGEDDEAALAVGESRVALALAQARVVAGCRRRRRGALRSRGARSSSPAPRTHARSRRRRSGRSCSRPRTRACPRPRAGRSRSRGCRARRRGGGRPTAAPRRGRATTPARRWCPGAAGSVAPRRVSRGRRRGGSAGAALPGGRRGGSGARRPGCAG